MRKLTFTNSEGSSVVFSDSSNYRTTKVNGLGVPDISVEEKGSPLQDGTVVIDQMVEARLITVEGILPTGQDHASRYRYRKELIAVLNPHLDDGVLLYENDYGSYEIPSRAIGIEFPNKNSNDATQKFLVSFYCPMPFFEDVEYTETRLSSIPVLKAPFSRYTFDSTTAPEKDLSGNDNDATLTGTTNATGISSNARAYNGSSDYAEILNPFFFSKSWALSLWFDPGEQVDAIATVFGCGAAGTVDYGLLIRSLALSGAWYVVAGTTTENVEVPLPASTAFQHVVVNYDYAPVVVAMSRRNVRLASLPTGAVLSYYGSGNEIRVYRRGALLRAVSGIPKDGEWSLSVTETGITKGTVDVFENHVALGNAKALTSNPATLAFAILVGEADGSVRTFEETQTFTKGLSSTLSSIVSYWLELSAHKEDEGAEACVFVSSYSRANGEDPRLTGGRILVEATCDGVNYDQELHSSTSDEETASFIIPVSMDYNGVQQPITSIRVRLYASGGMTTLLDEEYLPIVSRTKALLSVYHDDVLVGSFLKNVTFPRNTARLGMDEVLDTADSYFVGAIDEVQTFTQSLDSTDVAGLYGTPGSTVFEVLVPSTVSVDNDGDVEAPIEVEISGAGQAAEFLNRTTDEVLEIAKAVQGPIGISTREYQKHARLADALLFTPLELGSVLRGVAFSAYNEQGLAFGDSSALLSFSSTAELVVRNARFTGAVYAACYARALRLWCAVGAGGEASSSRDGIVWTALECGITDAFRGIAYSESLFLFCAVSDGTYFCLSKDGKTGTPVAHGGTAPFYGIAWCEALGLFCAVGSSGSILTSPDGETWTAQTSGGADDFYAVCASEDLPLFVATAADHDVYWSSDGVTWNIVAGSYYWYGVARSDTLGLFVKVGTDGYIMTSTDATSWTSRTSPTSNTLRGVAWDEESGKFVAVGDLGTVVESSNGTTWTLVRENTAALFDSATHYAFAYSEDLELYCVVGAAGAILTSPDKETWTAQTSGSTEDLNDVLWIESLSLFVAVGTTGEILASPDGVTWTAQTSGTSEDLNAVAWSSSFKLAVVVGTTGTVKKSLDCVTWITITSGTTADLFAVAESEALSQWVICAELSLLVSDDLVTFATRATYTGNYSSVLFDTETDLWIAGGSDGRIVSSPDGETWESLYGGSEDFVDVARLSSIKALVATGSGGELVTSKELPEVRTFSSTSEMLAARGARDRELVTCAGLEYRWSAAGAAWVPNDTENLPQATLQISPRFVPAYPDSPAGTTYRNTPGWTTGVDGWAGNYGTESLSIVGGKLHITDATRSAFGIYKSGVAPNGKQIIFRITAGEPILGLRYWNGSVVTIFSKVIKISDYEWIVSDVVASSFGAPILLIYLTNTSVPVDIDDIYIGTGAYLTPALDESGNGNHLTNTGVVPGEEDGRKVLLFNGQ
ncbi:MAG: phage tail domain-containing protein, partial [Patescibacteria group bacterium]